MTQIVGGLGRELRDTQTYAIIGVAMEIHRILGSSFLEPVYQAAVEVEFEARAIPYSREVELPIYYKGSPLKVRYRADFVCYQEVLVELKAIDRLTPRDDAQVINYLSATHLRRGILLNFGASSLQFKRFVGPNSPSRPRL